MFDIVELHFDEWTGTKWNTRNFHSCCCGKLASGDPYYLPAAVVESRFERAVILLPAC